jgi:hypothetical protein
LAKNPNFLGGPVLPGIVSTLVGLFVANAIIQTLPLPVWFPLIALLLLALILGRYYLLLLDGADAAPGSDERRQYLRLRRRLAAGGTPALVYNRWLGWALEGADRFFGDEGRTDRSRVAELVGVQTPGPRWTAEAFDRCLLLAFIYPIVSIIFVWGVSGHTGAAERALFLAADDPADHYAALRRILVLISILIGCYAIYGSIRSTGIRSIFWITLFVISIGVITGAGAGAVAFAITGALTGVGAGAVIGARANAGAGAGAVAVTVVIIVGFAVAFVRAGTGAVAGVIAVGFPVAAAAAISIAVAIAADFVARNHRLGVFQVIFFLSMMMICFLVAFHLAPLSTWRTFSPILLFLGILTLVNAPVDWLAVGFTRALLRRGLARGGWWPFLYALIDVLVAAILIIGLAFAMVIAIQIFDDIAVLRAGSNARTLPLGPLFEGLRNAPTAYENWWVWLLLFSSMIPSILNLSIAAAAFLRGWPRINGWILQRMPVGKAVAQRDRFPVAAALTAQLAGGVVFTGVAVYLVAAYMIPLGLPAFGAVVRDFAQDLADYNLPARLMIWLSGAR